MTNYNLNYKLSHDDIHDILDMYFKNNSLASVQLDSYNDFIDVQIPQVPKTMPFIYYDINQTDTANETKYKCTRVKIFIEDLRPTSNITEQLPNHCRIQNVTYCLNFECNLRIIQETLEQKSAGDEIKRTGNIINEVIPYQKMFSIPLMLYSNHCSMNKIGKNQTKRWKIENDECPYDSGGYFIIRGSEKTLLATEVQRNNQVLYLKPNKPDEQYRAVLISYVQEFSSYSKIELTFDKEGILVMKPKDVERQQNVLFILSYLYPGNTLTDEVLYSLCNNDLEVIQTFKKTVDDIKQQIPTFCKQDAIEHLVSQVDYEYSKLKIVDKKQYFSYRMCNNFLQHIGMRRQDNYAKFCFLLNMCVQLIKLKLGKRLSDDRDHWGIKRLESSGDMLLELFRHKYGDFINNTSKELRNRKIIFDKNDEIRFNDSIQKLQQIIETKADTTITKPLQGALATGNWNTGRSPNTAKTGASQSLVRLSYGAAISQIRRTTAGIEESSKAVEPRTLHTTQFGYLCPCETPEGGKTGLIKNFSLQCKISVRTQQNTKKVESILYDNVTPLNESIIGTKVIFNGNWYGVIDKKNAIKLIQELRDKRAKSIISLETSVHYNHKLDEIIIYTDSGRVLRPLFVLENNQLKISHEDIQEAKKQEDGWDYLIHNDKKLIEYLDPLEEEETLIATDQETLVVNDNRLNKYNYTHMEIHPCLILSAMASLTPFPDHNQAPRNLFQASMGKQAVGIYALNYQQRYDTQGINVLHYLQQPITQTLPMKYLSFTSLPAGENLIVSIAIYSSFNQEDSLIVSQSAVDRGMQRCWYMLSHESTCESSKESDISHGDIQEAFCRPIQKISGGAKQDDYRHLQADGIPKIGSSIYSQGVVIGKRTPKLTGSGTIENVTEPYKADDCRSKNEEIGYVDSVVVAREKEIFKLQQQSNLTLTAKVKVRSNRVVILGDKFSSRHGQKGTTNMLFRQQDLPYNIYGMSPDIIVNPHAIPSRMTIAQIYEATGGKFGCILGKLIDGTPFQPSFGNATFLKVVPDGLHQLGYQRYANEAFYNGFTGKLLKQRIFTGPTFYQRLKHMVLDKIACRSIGQVATLTKQPVEGRQRYGGLRVGEMERDAFIAHGACAVLRDRFMLSSDAYKFVVCKNCGEIVWHADEQSITSKDKVTCKCNGKEFYIVQMPYVAKLLIQECYAMGVRMQLDVE